jgi:hypothetical protein
MNTSLQVLDTGMLNHFAGLQRELIRTADLNAVYKGEVKSGATGTLRSLHVFMDAASHDIAFRLYGGPLKKDHIRTPRGKEFTLISLPYYLAGRIERYVDWLLSN